MRCSGGSCQWSRRHARTDNGGPGTYCIYTGHRLGSKRVSPDSSQDLVPNPVLMPLNCFARACRMVDPRRCPRC